jgi:hypothetical protein
VTLLDELVEAYKTNSEYDKSKIELAFAKISKAAEIDKYLHGEPLLLPAYKNLCLLRAVEATYYVKNNELFMGFILGWMSIEMTIYRIWYSHLKENSYTNGKIDELEQWNIDKIVETLYLSKCDPHFNSLKEQIEMLQGIRNKLLHGKIFEVTDGNTRQCINVALSLLPIKQQPPDSIPIANPKVS